MYLPRLRLIVFGLPHHAPIFNSFLFDLVVIQCPNILYHFIQFGSHASRGSFKTLKCHGSHGNFCKVPNSFGSHKPNIEIFRRLRR